MWRHNHYTKVDKPLANNVVVDYVIPYGIKECGNSSTCQIAKNLLRDYSAQRFYVEQVYRLGDIFN